MNHQTLWPTVSIGGVTVALRGPVLLPDDWECVTFRGDAERDAVADLARHVAAPPPGSAWRGPTALPFAGAAAFVAFIRPDDGNAPRVRFTITLERVALPSPGPTPPSPEAPPAPTHSTRPPAALAPSSPRHVPAPGRLEVAAEGYGTGGLSGHYCNPLDGYDPEAGC